MSATDSGITAELFLSGCPLCEEALDRAEELGISSVPAIALDGRLAACCEGGGVEETVLREAGLGTQG